jgi:hypothetical protein
MRLAMLKVLLLGVVLSFGVSAQPAGRDRDGKSEPWILWSWQCARPGEMGECAPRPDRVVLGRGPCLIAAKQARAADPGLVAHCRRFKEDRDGPQAAAPE